MNLISCYSCGVVLDKEVLNWPDVDEALDAEDYSKKAVWTGDNFTAILPCPVCGRFIRQDGKEYY